MQRGQLVKKLGRLHWFGKEFFPRIRVYDESPHKHFGHAPTQMDVGQPYLLTGGLFFTRLEPISEAGLVALRQIPWI